MTGGFGKELGGIVHSSAAGSDNLQSWPCISIPQIFPGMTTPVLKMYLIVGCGKLMNVYTNVKTGVVVNYYVLEQFLPFRRKPDPD